MTKLRPYQEEAIASVRAIVARVPCLLLVAARGVGKAPSTSSADLARAIQRERLTCSRCDAEILTHVSRLVCKDGAVLCNGCARRVSWRDVPRRFAIIAAAAHARGAYDLDGWARWVRGGAASRPGHLHHAIRCALARKGVATCPRVRRALRALYRWEHRQDLRVGGWFSDGLGPNGEVPPIDEPDDEEDA